MKKDVYDQVRFDKLSEALGLPLYQVVGVIQTLSDKCLNNALWGDIGRLEDKDIARLIRWEHDPARLIDALLESGWLVRHDRMRLYFPDWLDDCEDMYIRRMLSQATMDPKDIPANTNRAKAKWVFDNEYLPKLSPTSTVTHGEAREAVVGNSRPQGSTDVNGDARSAEPNRADANPGLANAEPLARSGPRKPLKRNRMSKPEGVWDTLARLGSDSPEFIQASTTTKDHFIDRVMGLTGDRTGWREWYSKTADIMDSKGAIGFFVEAVDYIEKAQSPDRDDVGEFEHPGRALVAKLLEWRNSQPKPKPKWIPYPAGSKVNA